MKQWLLEWFFASVLTLKVWFMAYPLKRWWPAQPSAIRILVALASGYLPCIVAELAGLRTFRFLVAYYSVLALVGFGLWVRQMVRNGVPDWERISIPEALLVVAAVVLWQWGFSPFYFMPSSDDSVVHAYLFDQILKHGALLSSFNSVPHQAIFGPHQYIFYPTGLHGVIAALGSDFVRVAGTSAELALIKGGWFSVHAWFILTAFRYSRERLMRDGFSRLFAGFGVLFLVYTWLWEPVREGALNRTASFYWAGVMLLQLHSAHVRIAFIDWVLFCCSFGLVLLVHPAGSLLALLVLAPVGMEILIMKGLRKALFALLCLMCSIAIVVLAQKAGVSHLAIVWEGSFPIDGSNWFREGLLLFYGWVRGGFWWQGDFFGVGFFSVTRAVLLLSGLFSLFVLNSAPRLKMVLLGLLGFALAICFLVKGGVKSAAPLTLVFYNCVGAYSGRLKEICGLIAGMVVLEGLVVWGKVLSNRLVNKVFTVAWVASSLFVLIGIVEVIKPYLLSTKLEFRPASAGFVDQGVWDAIHAPDAQVLVSPDDASRGIGFLKSSLPNEPVMKFPECLPEIGVTSAHCESRIRYLEEVFVCVRKGVGGGGQRCCDIARVPDFSRKRLILTWIDNSFGSVKILQCLPVE